MSPHLHPTEWHAKHVGGVLLVLFAWIACVSHLAVEWRYNPEYQFGWLLPCALVWLTRLRFRQHGWEPLPGRPMVSWGHCFVLIGALLMWLPVRLIGHANVDWHLMSWVTFALAFALTIVILHALGGWQAVRHYAPPFLIMAAAVPLPYAIEYHLIDTLKQLTTTVTLESLHLFGIAAERVGRDLITLRHVVLGIEDGCTGIRSLHLCLAAALFWGELHRLPFLRRAMYVFVAVILAVLMNSIRSVSLALLADYGGRDLFDQFHQLVGSIAQILTLTLAMCLVIKWESNVVSKPRPTTRKLYWPQMPMIQLHGWLFGGLAVALLMMEGARVMWFGRGSDSAATDGWTFQLPSEETTFRTVPFPKRWARQMGADFTLSTEWSGPEQSHRVAHYIKWSADNPAALTVRGHQPEICLAGAGFELKGTPLLRRFRVGESDYLFRRYQFDRQGADVVVYFGVWSSDGRTEVLQEDSSIYRRERLMRAWRGEGNQGRRLIEVGFWDATLDAADLEMAAFVRRTVQPVERSSMKGATYATR